MDITIMRRAKRFTVASFANLTHDGLTPASQRVYEGDGSGLCINLRPEGTKSWIQIIAVRGKRRHIGLGPYPLISLKEAREKAWANKRLAHEGKTPLKNLSAPSMRRTSRHLLSKSSRFSPRTTPAGSQRRSGISRSRATPPRRSAASWLLPSPLPMSCRVQAPN